LPLSDPAAIAHARDLVTRGPDAAGSPIVVASIAPGADGINLDYLSANHRAWDWHLTGLSNFADSTVEILDGWPAYVQQDVPCWSAPSRPMPSYLIILLIFGIPSLLIIAAFVVGCFEKHPMRMFEPAPSVPLGRYTAAIIRVAVPMGFIRRAHGTHTKFKENL